MEGRDSVKPVISCHLGDVSTCNFYTIISNYKWINDSESSFEFKTLIVLTAYALQCWLLNV